MFFWSAGVESESIVYGCIRDWPSADPEQCRQRRANNLAAVQALPQGEAWPFIGREMFSFCAREDEGLYQTQVIHFGASYRAVEMAKSSLAICRTNAGKPCQT